MSRLTIYTFVDGGDHDFKVLITANDAEEAWRGLQDVLSDDPLDNPIRNLKRQFFIDDKTQLKNTAATKEISRRLANL